MTHLDEGTIHAWLDGERRNDADEIERHVAACPECSARVAEARGLLAGASRILSALDDVGVGIVPDRAASSHERPAARVRPIRVIAWLAAAGLIVAVGVKTVGRPAGEPAIAGGVRAESPVVGSARMEGATVVAKPSVPAAKPSTAVGGAAKAEVRSQKIAQAPPPSTLQAAPAAAVGMISDSLRNAARVMSGGRAMHLNEVVAAADGQNAAVRDMARAEGGLGRVPMCYMSSAIMLMLDTMPIPAGVGTGVGARMLRDTTGTVGEWARLRGDSVELRWALGGRMERGVVEPKALRLGAAVLTPIDCRLIAR